jgi:lysophospholipase L1-like esterase
MAETNEYTEDLRRIRSLLVVTSLQKRDDLKAVKLIRAYTGKLKWKPFSNMLIDAGVWRYAVEKRGYDPKCVFCHPDVLQAHPATSLYYRGLCGLSLKAAKSYFGAVEALESGSRRAVLKPEKALKMARTYNAFICSIIDNSTDWTLENGNRTIIATLGITIDGVMRNKVGEIAEERIRTLLVEWLVGSGLVLEPQIGKEDAYTSDCSIFELQNGVTMQFSSEPDVAFSRGDELLAVIEIKGGVDPAGALERYGAATKHSSIRSRSVLGAAISTSSRWKRLSWRNGSVTTGLWKRPSASSRSCTTPRHVSASSERSFTTRYGSRNAVSQDCPWPGALVARAVTSNHHHVTNGAFAMTPLTLNPNATILFQGDSVTDAGRTASLDPATALGEGYPALIAKRLAGSGVTVINRGISGHRVYDLEARWTEDCIALQPDVVSILIGINDTWRRYDSDLLSPIPKFEASYRRMLDRIRAETSAKIALLEPFVLPIPDDRVEWREDLDPRIHAVRKLAREYNTILITLDGIFAEAATREDMAHWAEDGVHPTAAGHELIADVWMKAVLGK